MHHGQDNEGLTEVMDEDQEELQNKLNEFEKRLEEEKPEEKADTGTTAEAEAKLRKAVAGHQEGIQGLGKPIGPTGKFPEGKLTPHDEGQVQFMVGHTKDKRKVVLDFGNPISWIGMSAQEAFGLSKMLRKHAKKCKP